MASRFYSTLIAFLLSSAAVAATAEQTLDMLRLRPGTLPATGKNGMLRVETSTNKLKKYNETTATWQEISGGGGGTGVGGLSWLASNNPQYEDLLVGWTNSGGTFSTASAGANLLQGTYSATFDASSSGQYFESAAITPPNGLKNGNCVASARIKGDASLYQLKVIVGSTTYSQTLDNYGDSHTYYLFYPCGDLSVTSKVRIESTGNGAQIAVDDWYAGDASPLLSQADSSSLYGTLVYPNATNCVWQTTSGSYTNLSADADCTGAVATGALSVPGTQIPGFVAADMPAGEYVIIASGGFQSDGGLGPCGYRISDGTNQSGSIYAAGFRDVFQAHFSYSESATRTFQIQVISDGVNQCDVFNSGGTASASAPLELKFTVIRLPQSDQLAIKPGDESWRVDVNISGSNPSLGTSNVASYTEITDAGLTMTINDGLSNVQIPCSGTNPSTGLTCSAGSESVGVAFNLPKAIPYEVCVEFSSGFSNSTSFTNQAFQIVETPNNAQTVLAEGNSRTNVSFDGTLSGVEVPHRTCGVFYPTSSGLKTLRLMYEQQTGGSTTASYVIADASTAVGQRDIHITVTPWLGLANSPLLVNSVVSPNSAVTNLAYMYVASGGSISAQSGAVFTLGSATGGATTGRYGYDITPGTFSSQPVCVASPVDLGVTEATAVIEECSTTRVQVHMYLGGAASNIPAMITVIGPKN